MILGLTGTSWKWEKCGLTWRKGGGSKNWQFMIKAKGLGSGGRWNTFCELKVVPYSNKFLPHLNHRFTRCPSSVVCLKTFFFRTTRPNLTKLGTKHHEKGNLNCKIKDKFLFKRMIIGKYTVVEMVCLKNHLLKNRCTRNANIYNKACIWNEEC